MDNRFVPLIDLTEARSGDQEAIRAAAHRMNEALKQSGFFVVAGHGVPEATIDGAVAAAEAFFDKPMEEKMAIASTAKGSPRGYVPFGLETLSKTEGQDAPPDLKEAFSMGPDWVDGLDADRRAAGYTLNVWPDDADFRSAVNAYYAELEKLTALLMKLFAVAMELEEDYFTDRFATHNSTLRLFHYPPLDRAPLPGQLRAGAHTDYGALTILLGQDRPGGLQVRMLDGTWEDVAAPPNTFVINIGDLMMTWSNDSWLSNAHRVAVPPSEADWGSRRYSLAYFCNPNDDLLIECIPTRATDERPAKYAPFLAREHRNRKINMSQGG